MTPLLIEWIWPDTPITLALIVGGALICQWLIVRGIKFGTQAAINRARTQRQHPDSRAQQILAKATGADNERYEQRISTVGSLLRNLTSIAVGAVLVLTLMTIVGIPLAPLLASAGVGGVALGFGAQSLVKDFLSGVFMIIEDQYGVGDVIDTGEAIGTVEEVTLRITRLRDANGVTWYVRNGEIIRIGNRSQGVATATVDMPVSYAENVDRVVGIIREAAAELGADPDWQEQLIEPPTVLGVESIIGTTMTVRTVITCAPGEQFAVQRELRERLENACLLYTSPSPRD